MVHSLTQVTRNGSLHRRRHGHGLDNVGRTFCGKTRHVDDLFLPLLGWGVVAGVAGILRVYSVLLVVGTRVSLTYSLSVLA